MLPLHHWGAERERETERERERERERETTEAVAYFGFAPAFVAPPRAPAGDI